MKTHTWDSTHIPCTCYEFSWNSRKSKGTSHEGHNTYSAVFRAPITGTFPTYRILDPTCIAYTFRWIGEDTLREDTSRLRLKCDGTHAETRFRLSAKRTSPFKSAVASVQSITGSRGLRISGSNAGYTMVRGSVKSTGYSLHSPVSPSRPLPCVTVCHHISTVLYLFALTRLLLGGIYLLCISWALHTVHSLKVLSVGITIKAHGDKKYVFACISALYWRESREISHLSSHAFSLYTSQAWLWWVMN
jgi:hypothetical protein